MKIESWPLDRLKPYEKNPRRIPRGAVEAVAASIREFGWQQPVVVDREGVIVAGHTRYKAALKLALDEVPVTVADELSEEEVRAFRLADNRSAEISRWDPEGLAVEMDALNLGDLDMGEFGFSAKELAGSKLRQLNSDPYIGGARETDIQPGDVLVFGKGRRTHRLICGSALDADVRGALFSGDAPHLAVTDPPYAVGYDKHEFSRRFDSRFTQARTFTDEGVDFGAYIRAVVDVPTVDVVYIWFASTRTFDLLDVLTRANFEHRAALVWVKPTRVISRGHIGYRHEPCVYMVRRGAKSHWNGGRSADSVMSNETGSQWWPEDTDLDGGIFFARAPGVTDDHPTQKPLECMARPIRWSSRRGEIVYDPFLGSGTTLLAAEGEGRRCLGVELDPLFCESIRRRWAEEIGTKVERVAA